MAKRRRRPVKTKAAAGGYGNAVVVLAQLTRPGEPVKPDHEGDVILVGALEGEGEAVVSIYDHSVVKQRDEPVGRAVVREDGAQLVARPTWDDTPRGRGACKLVEESAPAWSVGYFVTRSRAPSAEERAQGAKRIIEKWRVREISPVGHPAGIGTGTTSACCESCAAGVKCETATEAMSLRVAEAEAVITKARDTLDVLDVDVLADYELPDELTATARTFSHWCAGMLNLDTDPAVSWFWPQSVKSAQTAALAWRGEIALNTKAMGAEPRLLLRTIAHETAHVAGMRSEAEANAFASRAVALWNERHGHNTYNL